MAETPSVPAVEDLGSDQREGENSTRRRLQTLAGGIAASAAMSLSPEAQTPGPVVPVDIILPPAEAVGALSSVGEGTVVKSYSVSVPPVVEGRKPKGAFANVKIDERISAAGLSARLDQYPEPYADGMNVSVVLEVADPVAYQEFLASGERLKGALMGVFGSETLQGLEATGASFSFDGEGNLVEVQPEPVEGFPKGAELDVVFDGDLDPNPEGIYEVEYRLDSIPGFSIWVTGRELKFEDYDVDMDLLGWELELPDGELGEELTDTEKEIFLNPALEFLRNGIGFEFEGDYGDLGPRSGASFFGRLDRAIGSGFTLNMLKFLIAAGVDIKFDFVARTTPKREGLDSYEHKFSVRIK